MLVPCPLSQGETFPAHSTRSATALRLGVPACAARSDEVPTKTSAHVSNAELPTLGAPRRYLDHVSTNHLGDSTRPGRRSLTRAASLVIAATLAACLAALLWSWTVDDFQAWKLHSALDVRGVSTKAKVLSYSYDPDGGDPDGWTTDKVAFVTDRGTTVVATVGHHAPGTEQATRSVQVTYDPQQPTLVRVANYGDDADDPLNALVGAIMASVVSLGAIALTMAAVIMSLAGGRRRRVPAARD